MFIKAKQIQNNLVPSSRKIGIGYSSGVVSDNSDYTEYSLCFNAYPQMGLSVDDPNFVMINVSDYSGIYSLYINNCKVYKIEDDGSVTQLEAAQYYTTDKPTTGNVDIRNCKVIMIFPYVKDENVAPRSYSSWYKFTLNVFS